jgi:formylglycine-generating enzyme required for sulfatase activity
MDACSLRPVRYYDSRGVVSVSRIFLSHASADIAQTIALRDWLVAEGWSDLFVDVDPERGIVPGERWERALNEAASRCEAVLILVSKAWLGSRWCMNELNLARRLNKRLFGVMIEEGISVDELPSEVTSTWQFVNLATGRDHKQFRVTMPITGAEMHVTFSQQGLARLKNGLARAGLHASFFNWPPENDPRRSPYRGLRPLEADDAGIFFGREAPIIKAIDQLRGLREAAPPRMFVIIGASGAGKSSFLRAGLYPRLARDPQHFLPLPIVRPESAALYGETGLLRALEGAFDAAKLTIPRADLRAAIQRGATALKPFLDTLSETVTRTTFDREAPSKPPTIVLSIDQGEEVFLTEGQDEAQPFLALLRDLITTDPPAVIPLFTIRSDNYERLQEAKALEGIQQSPFNLGPMPRGSYAEVIKGPMRRFDGTARALKIEDRLVDELLADIEAGGAKDALPLLAFTLERLYDEYHAGGNLKLEHYEQLGRVKGSIEAAVDRAFKAADAEPKIPRDHQARLALLRRGLIPWLAGIDPDTGAPRRRVARLSEIPAEARPLADLLVDQRLLSTDIARNTGEKTIEPAHEALLRQWGMLQGWLTEDAGLLTVMDSVKRASRDWAANGKSAAWVAHTTDRLAAAERLLERLDIADNLEPTDREYLAACRKAEAVAKGRKRRAQGLIYLLLVGVIGGLVGWINQGHILEQWRWWWTDRPFVAANIWPHVLEPATEHALKPEDIFRECSAELGRDYCPQMVVLPAGSLLMGSPATEPGHQPSEQPQHQVTIAKSIAVSKYELTFDEWDICADYGDCPQGITDSGWGRGPQPVINVTWDDAQRYVAWLSKMTGKPYRLLTEAEYEYAARAGSTMVYPWGDDIGLNNTNCRGCGSRWDNTQTAPVGSFGANGFGLFDMVGNVWEWVEDCVNENYQGAPTDGSAWIGDGDCKNRMARGGSWNNTPVNLRSANRIGTSLGFRDNLLGFRIARTLMAP